MKLKIVLVLLFANVQNSSAQLTEAQRAALVNANAANNNVVARYMLRTNKGANCFNVDFGENAIGRHDRNAYLLSYLSTAIYCEKLLEFESPTRSQQSLGASADPYQIDGTFFANKFRQIVSPYFSETTQYTGANMEFFENTTSFDGYDPEAMLIPMSNAIIVVFRGTDRVAQDNTPGSPGYEFTEWLQTDFQGLSFTPAAINNRNFVGKVHQGMWLSLDKIASRLAARIKELGGGTTKKVWITGHSLGAGLAQLFGYYLAKFHDVVPQGIYAYASPQVGNAAFNTNFMTVLGDRLKLQRFDFMDDPITAMAAVVGFVPTGTRVIYPNINNIVFDVPNRTNAEIVRIIGSAPGSMLSAKIGVGFGGICFHQQNWYMQAAHKQLTQAQKLRMPDPLPIPTRSFMGCETGVDVALATQPNNPLVVAGNFIIDVTDQIIGNIGVAVSNMTGAVLPGGFGNYKITCLQGGKSLALYGSCNDQDGCQLRLWDDDGGDNIRFVVEGYGFGIGLRAKSTTKYLDVTGMSTANGAKVKTYGKHIAPVIPNNQIWYLKNVGGNRYIIQNERSGKVLSAENSQTAINGCEVVQWTYHYGSNNQVWVFEKVN